VFFSKVLFAATRSVKRKSIKFPLYSRYVLNFSRIRRLRWNYFFRFFQLDAQCNLRGKRMACWQYMTNALLYFAEAIVARLVPPRIFIHEAFAAKYFQSVFKKNNYVLDAPLLFSFRQTVSRNVHRISRILNYQSNVFTSEISFQKFHYIDLWMHFHIF